MDSSERARRVSEGLGSGVLSALGPLLLSGTALLTLPAALLGPPLSPVLLTLLVSLALLGGTLELYHLLLLVHAEAALERRSPSMASFLLALLSLSSYYFLLGILLISLRHNRLLSGLGCEGDHSPILDLLTLGLALSTKQRHLALCLKERLDAMQGG
ncbi:MAG: hypothetical protein ABDH61_03415 [Acidilobaceae archaeon]